MLVSKHSIITTIITCLLPPGHRTTEPPRSPKTRNRSRAWSALHLRGGLCWAPGDGRTHPAHHRHAGTATRGLNTNANPRGNATVATPVHATAHVRTKHPPRGACAAHPTDHQRLPRALKVQLASHKHKGWLYVNLNARRTLRLKATRRVFAVDLLRCSETEFEADINSPTRRIYCQTICIAIQVDLWLAIQRPVPFHPCTC